MDKRNIISATLLISALAFNPLFAASINNDQSRNSQRQVNSLSTSIANVLYKRGIDEDVAQELSQNIVDEHDAFLLDNLLHVYTSVSHKEIYEHLSTKALHREKIDFSSYDHLVSMLTKIKTKPLSTQELKQIRMVSKVNKLFVA